MSETEDNFYRAGADINVLDAPTERAQHVLERLGPPPFRKGAFPLMGFLASLYEHVAAHTAGANRNDNRVTPSSASDK